MDNKSLPVEKRTNSDGTVSESTTKIKIYVGMHKDFYVANNRFLIPIQVGSALAEKRIEGVLHDDEGDNISERNKSFCELTAQYWAWKNDLDADYYGFFHYRRYLSFNPVQLEHYENIVYFDYCDEKAVRDIMLNEKVMENLITEYDVIYPQENPVGSDTIYEHWVKHLNKPDIDLLMEIIMEKYPDFYKYAVDVINSKQAIHCNMFIMRKDIFNDYCEWLFDILFEHERRADYSDYSTEKFRTVGHLAERLCAIYGKYLTDKEAKICYLQRTLFKNNEKDETLDIVNKNGFVPVVLSCSNQYVKYTSVLINSIMQNSSAENHYCINIMNTDITDENKQILKTQIAQKDNFSLNFIDVKRRLNDYKNLVVDRYLAIQTYFRFFALDVFPNLDKILYLDCDTIVNADIAELFSENIDDFSLAAARDADIISLYPKENDADKEVRDDLDMNIQLENYTDYFQAGVILFNLKKIRSQHTVKTLLSTAISKKWKFADQDVLNYTFKGDVKFLDTPWNTLYECFNRMERIKNFTPSEIYQGYLKAKKEPKIIHYAGIPKPWEKIDADMGEYFWKYAKTAPMFELILHELNASEFKKTVDKRSDLAEYDRLVRENNKLKTEMKEMEKNGEVVFQSEHDSAKGEVGASLFKLTLDKFNYNNFYSEISFVKLENKGACIKDTLLISGTYHDESGKSELHIHQTDWENGKMAEWIYFYIIDNSIYFFGKYPGLYCGYHYTIKSLASRSAADTVKFEEINKGFLYENEPQNKNAWCAQNNVAAQNDANAKKKAKIGKLF